jgi:hypothetical protein
MVGGRLTWCYIGIGIAADDSQGSQGSQVNSHFELSGKDRASGERDREDMDSSKEEGNSERNRQSGVNPVSPVNCDCPTDPAKWVSDGARMVCPKCGKFKGRVRPDAALN